jgi:formylglycine-generating enzyme required for sulfatase activity
MGKAEKKSYRIQIIVALIGVAGVLGAAVILNWDKIFKEPIIPLPKPGDVVINSVGMKLVYIPAGEFTMGKNYSGDESPQHQVRISEAFWMGQTEVTQGQYESVMNTQPWSGKEYVQEDANNPAVYVSWDDAAAFCRKLSRKEGKTYRLPTEAEWEYACRAGTTTQFSFGDIELFLGDYAWFSDNTAKVGQGYAHAVG